MSEEVSWLVGSQDLALSITQSRGESFPIKYDVIKFLDGMRSAAKTVQIDTKLRELNKRLRVIHEDSGVDYGTDAKNEDEICRRFKTAVDLRNASLNEVRNFSGQRNSF